MRSGAPTCSAVRDQRQRVLGKARAAKARAGMQELAADAAVEPMPRATSCTSAPTFSQRSAISLMKVILVARKALAAYLISSAVSSAGEDDRRLDQIERPVELAHHLRARARSRRR